MPESFSYFRTPVGEAKYLAAYDEVLTHWPVPYETRVVITSFGQTHLIISGESTYPPLVLLPGTGSNATLWLPNVAMLSQHFRVYALDWIDDLGKSIPHHFLQSREEYVAWLLEIFHQLQIDRANVVGTSYGGFVTLTLALIAPQRVRRVGVFSPAGIFVPISTSFYFPLIMMGLFPFPWVVRHCLRILSARDVPLNEILLPQVSIAARYQRFVRRVIPTVFKDEELHQIAVPVLVLVGQEEIIGKPEAIISRARTCLPDVLAEIIPRAGHALNLDQPQLVNEHILRFFTQ